MMLHSIISWDCSYRNFFHIIDGLLNQKFSKDNFELIYIEQRSKNHANNFNHQFGLKSLEDIAGASIEDLTKIKGIGEKKAEKLIHQAKALLK